MKLKIVTDFKARRSKPKFAFVAETAKSSRSTCRTCYDPIPKGSLRIGSIRFHPHRQCLWHHAACAQRLLCGLCLSDLWGSKDLDETSMKVLATQMRTAATMTVAKALATVTGTLDLPRFADALSERYGRFRSFRFGLPETQMYTSNWNWRCFLATMLVCNTHESSMLRVVDQLFRVYRDPQALDALRTDKEAQRAWKDWMESRDIRHSGKKMFFILNANRVLLEDHQGEVPNDRETLQSLPGVGRHVASVTMAWVHNAPEFGVDTHVRRILQRWGYIEAKEPEPLIEAKVKAIVEKDKIGRFSRAFVDHGQTVCGYTPDCSACHLRYSCPTASKQLEW